jgi:hypothetical protein
MFSLLEKDNKSFNIIICYLNYFIDENNIEKKLFDFDNEIQKKEIEEHLLRNGYLLSDQYEICNWITKNAKRYRNYLNACKFIASLLEMRIIDKIITIKDVDQFYIDHLIDIYDERIHSFIDTAY